MPAPTEYTYDFLPPGQGQAAADLVEQTFLAQVAPLYSPQGVNEFLGYVSAQAIAERLQADNFMLAAYGPEGLTGIVEADSAREHIVWFFVKQEAQRSGVGRKLLAKALAELKRRRPYLTKVTVNSSPNSVEAYSALGFSATADQQEHNGIIFTTMAIQLD
jgi:GNAT superfamily N-acetyltransferase